MKKIIALSTVAILSTALYAEVDADTQALIDDLSKKIEKLEKKQKKNTKKLGKVNSLAAKDNLKFDVDLRTAYDNLQYKTASGTKYTNDALYSTRLWLGMGYAPTSTMTFKGQLSYNKAFGASYNQRGKDQGFDSFDWVVNESLTDDTLKVREAYWLWTPTVGGFPTTWSVGRRPSTNGYLINLRDDDKAKSPLGHVINMEFDGASASIRLDKYVPGMYAKLCLGRGLTNASAKFDTDGTDYDDESSVDNMDLAGVIFQPYDDGQYSVMTNYYRGFNVIGYNSTYSALETFGEMDGAAISAKIDGIGDEINDFLDNTIIFASFAMSQTRPDGDQPMLGSTDQEIGTSYWLGTQMPNLTGGKFGLEYNHGSKYWRSFTYGEDTMIGSKMATRGSAYEAYWTQPIIKDVFSMQIRYTYIEYDYTGSNAFFGYGGTPMTMSDAVAAGSDPVETSQDIRLYFRYRY
ncbi:MAG: hypothetical protein ACI9RG_000792 [Sulfurimonas sp.]|jgi:hypothetical protein